MEKVDRALESERSDMIIAAWEYAELMKPPILVVRFSGIRLVSEIASIIALVCQFVPALAASNDEFGSLVVSREHMGWPSPESLVRDLRSQDEEVRLKALSLIGVPDKVARPMLTAPRIAMAEQVELRYAALGGDETQQAIVVGLLGTMVYAAVAIPKANAWERIAVLDCWCKYDGAIVDTFIALEPAHALGRHEFVVRASGGGSGTYGQTEVRFRLYRGELKAVMSFVSRIQATLDPPQHLRMERRWFLPGFPVTLPDGSSDSVSVLVESRGEVPTPPILNFFVPDLQVRYSKGITCRAFRWDQLAFEYRPIKVPNLCK